MRLAPPGAKFSSPSLRTASCAYHRKNSAAYSTSLLASASALPFSSEINCASHSELLTIFSKHRESSSERVRVAVRAHSRAAAWAASTAHEASGRPAFATEARTSPVAGLMTSIRGRSAASCHRAPINESVGMLRPVESDRVYVCADCIGYRFLESIRLVAAKNGRR